MPLLYNIPRAENLFFGDIVSSHSALGISQYTQSHLFQIVGNASSVYEMSFGFFAYLENGEINENSVVSNIRLNGIIVSVQFDPYFGEQIVEDPFSIDCNFGYTLNNGTKTFTVDLIFSGGGLSGTGFLINGNYYDNITINVPGQTTGKVLIGVVFSAGFSGSQFFAFAKDVEIENPILVSGLLQNYSVPPYQLLRLGTVQVDKTLFGQLTDFAAYGVYSFEGINVFSDNNGDGYPDYLNINQLHEFLTNLRSTVLPGGSYSSLGLEDYNRIRRSIPDERDYFVR